jgi:hypothetical protein
MIICNIPQPIKHPCWITQTPCIGHCQVDSNNIRWFDKKAPLDICSLCGVKLSAEEGIVSKEDDATGLRADFHEKCFIELRENERI